MSLRAVAKQQLLSLRGATATKQSRLNRINLPRSPRRTNVLLVMTLMFRVKKKFEDALLRSLSLATGMTLVEKNAKKRRLEEQDAFFGIPTIIRTTSKQTERIAKPKPTS